MGQTLYTLLLCFFASSSGLAHALSLRDLVERAVTTNPTYRTTQWGQEIAGLNEQNLRASLYPSLDLSATAGILKANPISATDPWQSSLGLTLTENLYDNGATLTQIDSARLSHEWATLNALKARDKLTLDITLAFHQYSLTTLLAEVSDEQLTTLQKQADVVAGQYRQGLKMRKDFLRLTSQVSRGQIDLMVAKTAVIRARLDLFRLVAASPLDSPLNIDTLKQPRTANLPSTPPGLDTTFDANLSQLQNRIYQLKVNLAERKYWPQLNLSLGINFSNPNYLGNGIPSSQTTSATALLGLNYNILDWGIRRRTIAVARAEAQLNQAQWDGGLLALKAEIQSEYTRAQQLKTAAITAHELLKMETDTYNVIQREYSDGAVPYLDLVTSLSNLLSARVQALTIGFALSDMEARMHYYEGTLYENTIR